MQPGNWNHLQSLLIEPILTDPLMAIATLGLVLSGAYLLLMLVTRVGDVRPSVQSLVLSALLHGVLLTFWGALVIRSHEPSPKQGAEIPVRQVILEGEEAPLESARGNTPVWEKMPELQPENLTRIQPEPGEPASLEAPERLQEVIEPSRAELAELPDLPQLAMASPQALRPQAQMVRSAAEQRLQIEEETAQSRSDTTAMETSPLRQQQQRTGRVEEEVERMSRKGLNPDVSVTLDPSQQMASAEELVDPAAAIRRSPAAPVVQRRTGPAPTDLPIDDAGVANGTQTPEAGAGSPTAPQFTRSGRSTEPGESELMPKRTLPRRDSGASSLGPVAAIAAPLGSRSLDTGGPRPEITRPSLSAIPNRDKAEVPATYRLRNLPRRQKVALSLGATQESERAVELSLKWLALHQNPEGYWDPDGFSTHCPADDRCWGHSGQGDASEDPADLGAFDPVARQQAGRDADTGITALVILSFLGAGYTHEEGQYADQIDRALRWLIRQQTADGFLGGKANRYDRMYCHGMATYALGEACGLSSDPNADTQLRNALIRAVQYIVATQNPKDGGWRYLPGQEGDMSMFGWQLMALKSAEIAGIDIPADTRARLVDFLKNRGMGQHGGLAAYRVGERVKPSMTAEALFSRQMLGMKRSNAASGEAVAYLLQHLPKQSEQDLYYWYYGTLAMYQYGGEPWREWNDRLRDSLVATQRQSGHSAGSWDPRDRWGKHGGRLYATALSTLCLEVYYRFLPLYQLGGEPAEGLE